MQRKPAKRKTKSFLSSFGDGFFVLKPNGAELVVCLKKLHLGVSRISNSSCRVVACYLIQRHLGESKKLFKKSCQVQKKEQKKSVWWWLRMEVTTGGYPLNIILEFQAVLSISHRWWGHPQQTGRVLRHLFLSMRSQDNNAPSPVTNETYIHIDLQCSIYMWGQGFGNANLAPSISAHTRNKGYISECSAHMYCCTVGVMYVRLQKSDLGHSTLTHNIM